MPATAVTLRGTPRSAHQTGRRRAGIPDRAELHGIEISLDCDIEEARGCTGYVDSAYMAQPGATPIGIWVHGLEEACIIDARYLTRTGERLPVPPRGRRDRSTKVTVDGEIAGHTAYLIVDDIEQYL
jgi:hypothetical protein